MKFGIFDHMEQHATEPGHRVGDGLKALYEERLRMLEFADANGFARYHKAEDHFTVLDAAPSARRSRLGANRSSLMLRPRLSQPLAAGSEMAS